jgi:hypothetical protein
MVTLSRRHSSWLRVLLAVSLCLLVVACKASSQLFTGGCKADDEVSAKDRESVRQVALKFVQDALGPNTSDAYAAFTDDAKASVPTEQFVSGFQNSIKPMGPFKELRVTHTYLPEVTGGTQEQRVVCGNLSTPETWVAVNAKPGPAEAYAIVEGDTVNNTNAFVIWLIPEKSNWRVQYVHFATITMVGKSADDLQKIAATENAKQHNFNAFIFYAAALQLADRGPFFQLGIRPEIEKAIGNVQRPSILQGQAPFVWNFDKSTFRVLNVGPIGIGGKIYLLVSHEIEPWSEDKEADRKNRDLIAALAKAYPEYKEAFAGLVVRAHERGGNRGFGTVEQNQK